MTYPDAVRCSCVPVVVVLLVLVLACVFASARTLEQDLQGMRSPDPRVRVASAKRLGVCGDESACTRAAQALERALFDPEPVVRRVSVNALAELGARAATGSILKLLKLETEPQVIAAALVAVGRLRASSAMRVLVHYASDPRVGVRAAAITGAGDLGGPAARRLIANSLQMAGSEDAEWVVRAAALLALARAGKPEDLAAARRAYVAGRGDRYWLARTAWARVVTALDPSPRVELERLMEDPDSRVGVTAAIGLAKVGQQALVIRHLRNSQPRVRAAAIGAVRQGRLEAAYPQLRTIARYDGSRRVRWAAIVALFAVQDRDGDELMLDALRSDEPAIWTEAMAHLAERTRSMHGRDVKAWRRALAQHRKEQR